MRRLLRPALVALCAVLLCLIGTPALAAPADVWGACSATAPATKIVRVFPRPAPAGSLPAGTSALLCGDANSGYQHIAGGHMADWQALATYTGENWRDMADFAIAQILAAPQPGYPQYNGKNNTWKYKAPLQLKDADGQVRATYWPIVAIAAQDGKIITSYPTSQPK